ncbi:MAG: hypothetical protein AAGF60_10370 [Pseudomonadota bacterium]
MQHPADDLARAAEEHARHWLERATEAQADPRSADRLRAFAARAWATGA